MGFGEFMEDYGPALGTGLIGSVINYFNNKAAAQRQRELIDHENSVMEKHQKAQEKIYRQKMKKFAGYEDEARANNVQTQAAIDALSPIFEKQQEDLAKKHAFENVTSRGTKLGRKSNDVQEYLINFSLDQMKDAKHKKRMYDLFGDNYGVELRKESKKLDKLFGPDIVSKYRVR